MQSNATGGARFGFFLENSVSPSVSHLSSLSRLKTNWSLLQSWADFDTSSWNQNSNNEQYRILLSDGPLLQQAMLATQKNELVRTDKFAEGIYCSVNEVVCNVVQTRMWVYEIMLSIIDYFDCCWLSDCLMRLSEWNWMFLFLFIYFLT